MSNWHIENITWSSSPQPPNPGDYSAYPFCNVGGAGGVSRNGFLFIIHARWLIGKTDTVSGVTITDDFGNLAPWHQLAIVRNTVPGGFDVYAVSYWKVMGVAEYVYFKSYGSNPAATMTLVGPAGVSGNVKFCMEMWSVPSSMGIIGAGCSGAGTETGSGTEPFTATSGDALPADTDAMAWLGQYAVNGNAGGGSWTFAGTSAAAAMSLTGLLFIVFQGDQGASYALTGVQGSATGASDIWAFTGASGDTYTSMGAIFHYFPTGEQVVNFV